MTKREAWILRGFLALGAALTALTLIFPQVGMLEWVTMIPIALALYRLTDRGVSLWKAYRYGFFTVFVFYFILYHWFVYLYPLDFVGLGNGASVAVVIARADAVAGDPRRADVPRLRGAVPDAGCQTVSACKTVSFRGALGCV